MNSNPAPYTLASLCSSGRIAQARLQLSPPCALNFTPPRFLVDSPF